ncbi:MAG: hypothetical protein IPM07_14200 [Anaerolineales bacterium]|nr:hypothetical protein [Anaerolineales bacterium]
MKAVRSPSTSTCCRRRCNFTTRNDNVIDIGYSDDLAVTLNVAGKDYEYYRYDSGGHNISSPAFNEAMRRTIEFFQENL